MELSPKLKVKTLALLHLTYAKAFIEEGEEVRKITTIDEDFERERRAIREALNARWCLESLCLDP
jgi:hypothetical protein